MKPAVAERVKEEFFRLHPDWEGRYGERGRQLCVEDDCFHLEFLAGAVSGGSPAAFAGYARWTARVLSARGIEPRYLAVALGLIGQALAARLPEEEWAFVAGFLDAACAAVAEGQPDRPDLGSSGSLALTRDLFLQALLQGQRNPACTIALEAVREGHPVIEVYGEVLGKSLREVGRLWESNRITVAAEHTATAIVQLVLAQLYPLLPAREVRRGNALITGVEGELHQVGANMVADVLEADGWNVRFLGTNMPHAGVLQAVEDHRADAVGISAATLLSLPKVRGLVSDMREKLTGRCPRIVVGGGAFRSAPALAAEIGADACGDDLRSAPTLFACPPSTGHS
jgi:methanogenic corrinoid protein MtbC1